MELVKDLILNIEGFFLFYTIILFARYVYFLPLLKNRKLNAIILAAWFILSVAGPLVYRGTPAPIHLIFLLVYFIICGSKKPSRALVILIPVLLMLYSIVIAYNLYRVVIGERFRIAFCVIYALVIIAEILFMIFGEKWRIRFENEIQFRKVSFAEKGILYGASLMIFLFTWYGTDY